MRHEEVLRLLASERGRLMGGLGVRPQDEKWIGQEARAIASLVLLTGRRPLLDLLYRLARRAARIAR